MIWRIKMNDKVFSDTCGKYPAIDRMMAILSELEKDRDEGVVAPAINWSMATSCFARTAKDLEKLNNKLSKKSDAWITDMWTVYNPREEDDTDDNNDLPPLGQELVSFWNDL